VKKGASVVRRAELGTGSKRMTVVDLFWGGIRLRSLAGDPGHREERKFCVGEALHRTSKRVGQQKAFAIGFQIH